MEFYDSDNGSNFCEMEDSMNKKRIIYSLPTVSHKINSFYILWFYHLFPKQTEKLDYLNKLISRKHNLMISKLLFFTESPINHKPYYIFATNLLYDFYYTKHAKQNAIKDKYNNLRYLFQNHFSSIEQRESVISMFSTVQKLYFWFNRMARLYKYKKSLIAVSTDLCFNELSTNMRSVFVLYQNNKQFFFRISELLRIIRNALTTDYEYDFQVNSHFPKNPYNNQQLKPVDLYNFYFFMKFSAQSPIPLFFELWFLEGFDIINYTNKHDIMLRKMCIHNFTLNALDNNPLLYKDIRIMLREYKFVCPWTIDEDFPKEELIRNLRPYVYIFYLLEYEALYYGIMHEYEELLEKQFRDAYQQNPMFGTKLVKAKTEPVTGKKRPLPLSSIIMENDLFTIVANTEENNLELHENNDEEVEKDDQEKKQEHSQTVEVELDVTFNTSCLPFHSWNR